MSVSLVLGGGGGLREGEGEGCTVLDHRRKLPQILNKYARQQDAYRFYSSDQLKGGGGGLEGHTRRPSEGQTRPH